MIFLRNFYGSEVDLIKKVYMGEKLPGTYRYSHGSGIFNDYEQGLTVLELQNRYISIEKIITLKGIPINVRGIL